MNEPDPHDSSSPRHQTAPWSPNAEDCMLLLESIQEAAFITDQEGYIVAANPAAELLAGKTTPLIRQHFHQVFGCVISNSSQSTPVCPLELVTANKVATLLPHHSWRRDDGTVVEIRATFWPRLRGMAYTGSMILCQDVMKERDAEREIHRVATLAEHSPNPIVEFTSGGGMHYANTAMVNLLMELGFSNDDTAVVLPKNLQGLIQRCLDNPSLVERCEVSVGERHLAWSFFPIADSHIVRAYGVDITAAVQLRAAKEAAEQAVRAKSIFLASMSHEIRTPMNGIIGCAQLLSAAPLADQERRYAETIQRSGEALLALINDILDFSKIEAGKMTLEMVNVDLRLILRDTVTLLSEAAEKKDLTIRYQVGEDIPGTVRGDHVRLRQVLFNLVGNALKFTERGGVNVHVSRMAGDPTRPDTIWLRWDVRDTGIGVTSEQKAKLFQAFTQADQSTTRRFGGTGLGLAICKQLVEIMGGTIDLDSVPGQGSTFWFTTPLLVGTAETTPTKSVEIPKPTRSRAEPVRVLVVEDNAINQMVARRFLEKLGCKIDLVNTGNEALQALERTTYDLVLMDCQMPEMDGFEATGRIRQRYGSEAPRLPIIALTANAMEGDRARCLEAGMDDYLSKPITLPALREALDKWAA